MGSAEASSRYSHDGCSHHLEVTLESVSWFYAIHRPYGTVGKWFFKLNSWKTVPLLCTWLHNRIEIWANRKSSSMEVHNSTSRQKHPQKRRCLRAALSLSFHKASPWTPCKWWTCAHWKGHFCFAAGCCSYDLSQLAEIPSYVSAKKKSKNLNSVDLPTLLEKRSSCRGGKSDELFFWYLGYKPSDFSISTHTTAVLPLGQVYMDRGTSESGLNPGSDMDIFRAKKLVIFSD